MQVPLLLPRIRMTMHIMACMRQNVRAAASKYLHAAAVPGLRHFRVARSKPAATGCGGRGHQPLPVPFLARKPVIPGLPPPPTAAGPVYGFFDKK